jgi:thiamine pyrophosphate-dependent acetolactate synthase large subunit-like protein
VEIAEGEINFRVQGVTPVVADLRAFFEEALRIVHEQQLRCDCAPWIEAVDEMKQKWPSVKEGVPLALDQINPNFFISELSRRSQQYGANFTCGIGNLQMWTAQSCEMVDGQRLLMPGNHFYTKHAKTQAHTHQFIHL